MYWERFFLDTILKTAYQNKRKINMHGSDKAFQGMLENRWEGLIDITEQQFQETHNHQNKIVDYS